MSKSQPWKNKGDTSDTVETCRNILMNLDEEMQGLKTSGTVSRNRKMFGEQIKRKNTPQIASTKPPKLNINIGQKGGSGLTTLDSINHTTLSPTIIPSIKQKSFMHGPSSIKHRIPPNNSQQVGGESGILKTQNSENFDDFPKAPPPSRNTSVKSNIPSKSSFSPLTTLADLPNKEEDFPPPPPAELTKINSLDMDDLDGLELIEPTSKVPEEYTKMPPKNVEISDINTGLADLDDLMADFTKMEDKIETANLDEQVDEDSNLKVDKEESLHEIDMSKIRVYGPNRSSALLNQNAEFFVDFTAAGSGKITCGMIGPMNADIKLTQHGDTKNIYKVSYICKKPGEYKITIKFGGNEIPNPLTNSSPFVINVPGEVKESASEDATVGQFLNFGLRLLDADINNITAMLVDPNGIESNQEILDQGNGNFKIRFKPEIDGLYKLGVLMNDVHISGSPYDILAKQPVQGNAKLVKVTGQGIISGKVNETNIFKIDTSQSGGIGNIAILSKGPSKPEMKITSGQVEYVVDKAGKYVFTLKYNDEDVEGSPFEVMVE